MTLEVIFIKEELAGLGSAVIKVDPRIRNHIIKNKRKDFLDMSAVHAIDQIHLTQCFACQKFGHKSGSQFCQFHGQEKTVCLYSAKEHESKNCSVKRDPQKHNCSNCLNSTNNRWYNEKLQNKKRKTRAAERKKNKSGSLEDLANYKREKNVYN
ncbi:unnamed protein product [Gadus morhua 'NCC']